MEHRVRLLGEVAVDAHALPGATTRALVASLALAAPHAVSIEAIAADVWPEHEVPQHPKAAVQSLVSRVRKVAPDLITSGPAGYALATTNIDLREAETATDSAALDLWHGSAGSDLADAPIAIDLAQRATTAHRRLSVLRADELLAAQQFEQAESLATELLETAHTDEHLIRLRMRALASLGRLTDATALFSALRQHLRDGSGTSPAAETTALHAALLREHELAPARIGLRAAPNALLGRDDDLDAVSAMLREHRVVTVLGTGGLGKTRLAYALAERATATTVSVVVIPLASIRTAEALVPAIATALGVDTVPASSRLAEALAGPDQHTRVLQKLGERETLLVLDNCEQIIDAVALFVADAIAAPGLRVLATSRSPLELASEAVYPLAPLQSEAEPSPAAQLFITRAQAVRPTAVLPMPDVVRLCQALDGLPLAIELAAARVRTMSVSDIVAHLDDRFALLRGNDRGAPERHRTLEAVIAWSWDLLDDDARRALATLSVFPAGFSADAARALVGRSAHAALDALASQSLLMVIDTPFGARFRMLETVREFAATKLDDPAAAHAKLHDWARAFAATRLDRPLTPTTYADVRHEHDTLVAVMRDALAAHDNATAVTVFGVLCQEWMIRGAIDEMLNVASLVLTTATTIEPAEVPPLALAATIALAASADDLGTINGSNRLAARLRIERRRGSLHGILDAMVQIATVIPDLALLQQTVRDLHDQVDASEFPYLRPLIGELVLASLAENDGALAVASASSLRGYRLATDNGDVWLAALSATTAAQLHSQRAEPHDALHWLDVAADLYAKFDVPSEHIQQLWMRGANLISTGEFAAARALFGGLADGPHASQDSLDLPSIGWFGLAELARATGDTEGAARHYLHSLQLFNDSAQGKAPWYLMAVTAMVAAASIDDTLDESQRAAWANRLRVRGLAVWRARQSFVDLPIFGSVLAGWGAWALTQPHLHTRAVQSLALAEAMGARQDLPSLHLVPLFARAGAVVGESAVAQERESAARLQRDQLIALAVAALRSPDAP